jgi:hypothetical protein
MAEFRMIRPEEWVTGTGVKHGGSSEFRGNHQPGVK